MNLSRRAVVITTVALAVLIAGGAPTGRSAPTSASAATLPQLNSQLASQQARQQHLSSSVASLSGLIASLDHQIALVQSREAAVRQQLAVDQAALARAAAALHRERALVLKLRKRLAWSRMLLSRQLVASYEGDKPDLVTVVLDASGFNNLLEQINFLSRAERQQQSVITITRRAKAAADSAASRLGKLEARDRQLT